MFMELLINNWVNLMYYNLYIDKFLGMSNKLIINKPERKMLWKQNKIRFFPPRRSVISCSLPKRWAIRKQRRFWGLRNRLWPNRSKSLNGRSVRRCFIQSGKIAPIWCGLHDAWCHASDIRNLKQGCRWDPANDKRDSGSISIGILASIESSVFASFITDYYKHNHGIKLTLHSLTRKEIWERLENNTIDLAVTYLPDESIKNWKPYESKKIVTEDLLFIHNNEELSKRKRIRLKDTLTNDWVTYPPQYYVNDVIREAYKNALIDKPTSVAHFATPAQLFSFANKTDVYTALPTSFVEAHNNGRLMTALFEPEIKFDLSLFSEKAKIKFRELLIFKCIWRISERSRLYWTP